MSLHVYDWVDKKENSIPLEVIKDNNTYFDSNTLLVDCEIVRFLLRFIDGATYYNKDFFLTKDGARYGYITYS